MADWHQLIITGSEKTLRGFVAGFAAASGLGEVSFGSDLGIEPASLASRVRELVAPGAAVHSVYAPSETAARLAEALAAQGERVGLRLAAQRPVLAASFSFQAETFSKEVASAIKEQLLAGLPATVEKRDAEEEETYHPDAEGAELYAPDHPYAFRARATLRGPFSAIVELHRRARSFEHVTATPLALETRQE